MSCSTLYVDIMTWNNLGARRLNFSSLEQSSSALMPWGGVRRPLFVVRRPSI